ncbi:MAG: lipopolysaccharide biosynthesis protein [Rhizobiaceae bacterium]
MSNASTATHPARSRRLRGLLTGRGKLAADYFSAISGSAGRLIFSLVYFVALANTLSIADFGLFATASAAGVMLSRILAFGFIAPLYRVSTTRPRLIGTFAGGFLFMGALSLPVLGAAGLAVYWLFFAGDLTLGIFLTVLVAEALLWRPSEVVIIVNNGLGRFGRGAIITILGSAIRMVAALGFMLVATHDLGTWGLFYLAANAVAFAVSLLFFWPRQRIRIRPRLYWRRLADSIYVAGAEVLFYLQMEFDKLLVLSFGGPELAGIYAIIMRLVDLTAIPIRTFTMMLVQKIMQRPGVIDRLTVRFGIEAGVFAVSTMALGGLALILHVFPHALGSNVAEAEPLIALAIFIPGLRNLVEYQAELLFARGQTLIRVINLALLAAAKAVVLIWLLRLSQDTAELIWWLNGGFALLYLASALLTHSALRLPAKKF